MTGNVQNDFVLRLRARQESEKRAAHVLRSGVFVEQHPDVVLAKRSAIGGQKKVPERRGVLVRVFQVGKPNPGIRIMRYPHDDGKLLGGGAIGSNGGVRRSNPSFCHGQWRIQKKGSVVNAFHLIVIRNLDGIAPGVQTKTGAVPEIQLAEDAVRRAGRGHHDVRRFRVHPGIDAPVIQLARMPRDVHQHLIEIRRSDYVGAVGIEQNLQLRNFQGDGLVDVRGRSRQKNENRQKCGERHEIEARGRHGLPEC
jgi:hypothetical protein